MSRLAVLVGLFLAISVASACSIADPYPFSLPRFAPEESHEFEAPDLRLRYIEIGRKGNCSASCEGFGTVAFSIPKGQLPEGFGLYFEQVQPNRYIQFGPHGPFWTDYEIDGYQIFLFPWSHSIARSERVSVTLRIRIVSKSGVAGRDTYLRYQIPAASEI